jgi:hypothetical protein
MSSFNHNKAQRSNAIVAGLSGQCLVFGDCG